MTPAAHKIEVRREQRERGAVAHVIYDQSRRLNVVGPPSLRDLADTFHTLAKDDDLRAVVFSGAGGRAFIGGADINYMAALREGEEGRAFITLIHKLCQSIRDCPVPVICRMEGYTLGAGLEVAAACDMRIAAETAFFGMPEVKVGLPSVVEAALIPQLIGFGRARELMMLGEIVDAEAALRWGLVERVVAPEALDAEIDKVLSSLLAAGPLAMRAQKRLMQAWERLPPDDAIAAGVDAFERTFASDEARRMLSAFTERRRR